MCEISICAKSHSVKMLLLCVNLRCVASDDLEQRLAERMLAAFNEAKRLKYNASRFFQMLSERGALPSARALLSGSADKVSDGFTAMWSLKRLDLTVEAICLDPIFKSLFTSGELLNARKRLENVGYLPTPQSQVQQRATFPDNPVEDKRMRIFLCHSSTDKPAVRDLYRRLKSDGFSPWLDEEDLLPGQDWRHEISSAVKACNAVIVCLSRSSVTKEGYVQKEIKIALDVAEEKPQGTIFIIPTKLEDDVQVPDRLSQWHWVNLFQAGGYEKLVLALQRRAAATSPVPSSVPSVVRSSKVLQFFNFNGASSPILISGSQHSVHGPHMDLWGLVTVVNYSQSPLKIGLGSLVFDGADFPLVRFFFRLRSKPERFERISLLGNNKEDYELHFMFPDNNYPKNCTGKLIIETDTEGGSLALDISFS